MTNHLKRISLVCFSILLWSVMASPPEVSYTAGGESLYLPIIKRLGWPVTYLETHDGDPTSPTPWIPSDWDITVHSRDEDTWFNLQGMDAAHGADCAGPPNTHPISAYQDTVFNCRNHIMTAIYATGYGIIYRTPDHMVDFSEGEAVVQFEMSTLRSSGRDWPLIYITPYEDNLQLPLAETAPDLNGEPNRGIKIQMRIYNSGIGEGNFKAYRIEDHIRVELPRDIFDGYEEWLEPSPTRRDLFEIRISRNRLSFGMPDYGKWWFDDAPISPPLDWDTGVLQLGHISYNPEKACDEDGTCGPNSWHWDNVMIDPARPFTILRANRRFVNRDSTNAVVFPSSAPANAHLRFAGIGENIQVSFNDGADWEPAQIQAQLEYNDDKFQSYWTPIPEGTERVRFRGLDWWGGGWHVRDITIWSQAVPSPYASPNSLANGDINPLLLSPGYCTLPDSAKLE